MKEFILTETSSERAVLVGLITPKVTERQVQDYLDALVAWEIILEKQGYVVARCIG